jgi:hypothetical protein
MNSSSLSGERWTFSFTQSEYTRFLVETNWNTGLACNWSNKLMKKRFGNRSFCDYDFDFVTIMTALQSRKKTLGRCFFMANDYILWMLSSTNWLHPGCCQQSYSHASSIHQHCTRGGGRIFGGYFRNCATLWYLMCLSEWFCPWL